MSRSPRRRTLSRSPRLSAGECLSPSPGEPVLQGVTVTDLVTHYVNEMKTFESELLAEDDFFNREEHMRDRLDAIQAAVGKDRQELNLCAAGITDMIRYVKGSMSACKEPYKYSLVATSIITSPSLIRMIFMNSDFLNELIAYLDANVLDEVTSWYWTSVMKEVLEQDIPEDFFIRRVGDTPPLISRLTRHLANDSIMNFIRIVIGADPEEAGRSAFLPHFVGKSDLIPSISSLMCSTRNPSAIANSCELLTAICNRYSCLPSYSRTIRDRLWPALDRILTTLGRRISTTTMDDLETLSFIEYAITTSIEIMSYESRAEQFTTFCDDGTTVRNSPGSGIISKSSSPAGRSGICNVNKTNTAPLLIARALQSGGDIKKLLLKRGTILVKAAEYFCSLIQINNVEVNNEISNLEIIPDVVALFFSYAANDFLRHVLLKIIISTLRTGSEQMRNQLLLGGCLLPRMQEAYINRQRTRRQGLMGHLNVLTDGILTACAVSEEIRSRFEDADIKWLRLQCQLKHNSARGATPPKSGHVSKLGHGLDGVDMETIQLTGSPIRLLNIEHKRMTPETKFQNDQCLTVIGPSSPINCGIDIVENSKHVGHGTPDPRCGGDNDKENEGSLWENIHVLVDKNSVRSNSAPYYDSPKPRLVRRCYYNRRAKVESPLYRPPSVSDNESIDDIADELSKKLVF